MSASDEGGNFTEDNRDREFHAVSRMIATATDYGLLTEVILLYGDYRAEGQEVVIACANALNEWDI